MSVRASASLPSSCSGAMYWNVPRIVPFVGDLRLCRGRRRAERTARQKASRGRSFRQAEVEQLGAALRRA